MSQDIVADALNQILNAKKAGKLVIELKHRSKLLSSVLAIAKLHKYVKSYKVTDNILKVEIGRLNKCCAIKPRTMVKSKEIEKYIQRYLPAKNLGIILLTTSQGLMTHTTALEKNIGGSLVAYMY